MEVDEVDEVDHFSVFARTVRLFFLFTSLVLDHQTKQFNKSPQQTLIKKTNHSEY